MDFFPVFLKLSNKQVLVVGGGEVACRKVDLLLKANANITLLSPELHPYLQNLVDVNKLTHLAENYNKIYLDGFDQVWATTDVPAINRQVYADAKQKKIWTNVVDDPKYCDFITPSIIDRTPIQVAISSGGASPVLIRFLREQLETQLPQNLNLLAQYSGEQRQRIKAYFSTVDERRKFWEKFFRLPEVEKAENYDDLETAFVNLLTTHKGSGGNLYLIETGCDPELLSMKALRLMQQSEFILYPEKQNSIFIDLCRRDADRANYCESTVIEDIKQLLKENLRVCVLAEKNKHCLDLKQICEDVNGIFVPIVA